MHSLFSNTSVRCAHAFLRTETCHFSSKSPMNYDKFRSPSLDAVSIGLRLFNTETLNHFPPFLFDPFLYVPPSLKILSSLFLRYSDGERYCFCYNLSVAHPLFLPSPRFRPALLKLLMHLSGWFHPLSNPLVLPLPRFHPPLLLPPPISHPRASDAGISVFGAAGISVFGDCRCYHHTQFHHRRKSISPIS